MYKAVLVESINHKFYIGLKKLNKPDFRYIED